MRKTQTKEANKKTHGPLTRATASSRLPPRARGVDAIVSMVGEKVSDLRRIKGLSLQQLAEISDVSSAAIHKIERSGMVPTITTLLKLAAALGVSVGYFVEEDETSAEPVHYTAADRRQAVYTPHKGLSLSGITGSYRQFQTAAAIGIMAPGATSGDKVLSHSGEELIYILSGEILFRINGRDYTLRAGDSLQFNGNIPHHWENRSRASAEMLWVVFRNED
jgi:transcriptional regulator with XRE-family HTH domain